MCGILGVFSPAGNASHAQTLAAIERLRHRGPDDQGIWLSPDGRVSLAHRRLSLVALDNGHQPIFNEDRTIVAVVNGEFYGYRAIRQQLLAAGHRFQLECDSEIVVHLYEQFGLDFVHQLRGEFALLLWDQQRNRLLAARDRFGIKPLVYNIDNRRRVMFASEAKALLPELAAPSWDAESFFWACSIQYLPPSRTLFEQIQLVPPGHLAIVDADGMQITKYWDLDYPLATAGTRDVPPKDRPAAAEQIRALLKTAVLDRLAADAPVCFHLSGGLDSSSALGIASRETGVKQHAFTICFADRQYDERDVARQAARFCDADMHLICLSENELIENLHAAARASEGLAINGHLPAKYLLNKAIRERGFKAAITGEGADETFFGYAHLRMDWWNHQAIEFRRHDLEQSNHSSIGMMLPYGNSLPLNQIARQLGYIPTFLAAKASLGYRLRSLVNDDIVQSWQRRDALAELCETAQATGQLAGRTSLHQSAWLWTKLALAGYILKTLGDGTEMAASVEGRVPFLDHQLFEYARTLPAPQLMNDRIEKHVLREAVKPYVPETVYRRQKHPFDTPPLLLNRSGEVQEFLFDQVASEAFRKQPFFDSLKVKNFIRQLPQMDRMQRQIWDPVFVMISCTVGIQQLISAATEVKTA